VRRRQTLRSWFADAWASLPDQVALFVADEDIVVEAIGDGPPAKRQRSPDVGAVAQDAAAPPRASPPELQDRRGSAAGQVVVSADVEPLLTMGFSKDMARRALKVTGGDVQRAVNWLLQQ
jgi:UBA/TS-N domain